MKRNKFNMSNDHHLTASMGNLIPINVLEVNPGDVVQGRCLALIRLNKVLRPVMTPIYCRIHHWFVPNRLVWDDWEEFITGYDSESAESTKVHPYIAISADPGESSLLDYLGIPSGTYGVPININALPVRAYALIYNEMYRDQQLQSSLTIDKTDGADSTTNVTLQKCNWPKDYFTTCRSAPQLGTQINIPLSGDAPITGFGMHNQAAVGSAANSRETDGTSATAYTDHWSNTFYAEEDPANAGYPNIRANLAAASGMDINELRLAIQKQAIMERRNNFGTRYVEYLLSEFGVMSSDARLNNPEFLGGGKNVLSFSEIAATDSTNTGDLYGHGIGAIRTNRFRRFFEEHGYVISLMSVIPKPVYANGLARNWSYETKEDYFNKSLQVVGEQEVYNKELYVDDTDPTEVFGYQNRYDHLRHAQSRVSGEFMSTENEWHAARIFAGDVALNSSLITCNPTKRYLTDTVNDSMYITVKNQFVARKPMMKYAIPMTF